ncbi:hypothetical protein CLOM_g21527 [Closterium sp. NIES-68]|nr:hypothetical protein CLOM_g21527 [Closterium sp. NIES-68]GJP66210.1 hypothetical protein CLOP_g23111 [Closterium sp. NIES-67]
MAPSRPFLLPNTALTSYFVIHWKAQLTLPRSAHLSPLPPATSLTPTPRHHSPNSPPSLPLLCPPLSPQLFQSGN